MSLAETRSHSITPEQFLRHDAEMREAKREKDDAGAALARVKKSAKDGAVDLKAYKFIEQLRRLDDDEQIVVVRHMMQMITWLEMPIGTQFSMIDAPKIPAVKTKARQQHALFVAREAGLKAGRAGEAPDANPHTEGTEEYVVWAKSQREGFEERATAARMQEDSVDGPPVADNAPATTGRGRGRPRGVRNGEMALDNARRHLAEDAVH